MLHMLGKVFIESFAFFKHPKREESIIFFSEGIGDWSHLEGYIQEIIKSDLVLYLYSEKADPGGKFSHNNFKAFYIGNGYIRTLVFKLLQCKIMVMTMPDLGVFHLKRSIFKVHYFYVFHSLASSHTWYRKNSLNYYDTYGAAGPHHLRELNRLKELKKLRDIKVIKLGYPRLDKVIRNAKESVNDPPIILLAPTYGNSSFLRFNGHQIIKSLLENNLEVIFRPHPMSFKKEKKLIKRIINSFSQDKRFKLDVDPSSTDSLESSNLLITDWSGVSVDFSLGLGKKVLFIDTPQKILNSEYKLYNLEPFEEKFRQEVGEIISLKDLNELPRKVWEMLKEVKINNQKLNFFRRDCIYNLGNSAQIGAEEIINLKSIKS